MSNANTQSNSSPATKKAASVAHETVNRVASTASEAEARLREGAEEASVKAREAKERAKETASESAEQIRGYVNSNPLTTAGIAFAAGIVLSTLLRR